LNSCTKQMKRMAGVLMLAALVFTACAGEDLVEAMRELVPLYEGATILDTGNVPGERESIIQFEVDASLSSEDDIIDFYRDAMTERGWEFEEIKRWPGNGSVFSMTEADWGTLTVQTVTREIESTGKIRVVLNLRRA